MATKKKRAAKRKVKNQMYSYDEYRKAFYPKAGPSSNPQTPEAFGAELAEQVLKHLKQEEVRS